MHNEIEASGNHINIFVTHKFVCVEKLLVSAFFKSALLEVLSSLHLDHVMKNLQRLIALSSMGFKDF